VQSRGRPLADSGNAIPNLRRQIVYMMRIPGIVFISDAAAFGSSGEFTPKQDAESQQERSGLSSDTPAKVAL
jgi:hypothetical protein